eukprot:CAMPEP_0172670986 /NCGR_PEP_ID=MMETSP1074-20121228/10629_1 /TAXON_ID=2916 /ORGANISM="Ceratium fusus, Strain PA161109" /LENGTH=390 /DNA_ID=CAMNT_0013487967 /DNA_START=32 /DNA_END=1205 /DNA_ORIENTATION=-
MGASTCSVAGLCGRDAVPGPTVPGPVPEAAPGRFGNREGNDYDVAGGMSGHSCGSSFRNGSPHSGHDHVQMHPRPNTAEASLAANYLHREDGELCTLIPGGNGQLGKRTRRRWQFGTGAVYDGQWLGNARDGMGKMSWPDGAEYFGEWVRNTATGQGMFCHLDGDAYVGQWRSNLAHGYGIFTAKDGLSYIGEFFDDLQEGFGVQAAPMVPGSAASFHSQGGSSAVMNGRIHPSMRENGKTIGFTAQACILVQTIAAMRDSGTHQQCTAAANTAGAMGAAMLVNTGWTKRMGLVSTHGLTGAGTRAIGYQASNTILAVCTQEEAAPHDWRDSSAVHAWTGWATKKRHQFGMSKGSDSCGPRQCTRPQCLASGDGLCLQCPAASEGLLSQL